MMDEKEQQLWDLYYSGVVGWCLHPRNLEKDQRSIDTMLMESAEIVDKMIEVRRKRLCRGE